jgi:hypothetical protein
MSEPDERDHLDGTEPVEGSDKAGATKPRGHSDVEPSDLSETGVGLGLGEPNTFEPEEADPDRDRPAP